VIELLWLVPGAWVGLLALAIPIAIHLLQRREAPPMPFPTLRFLVPSRPVSIRQRLPSDWLLLLIRMGIVLAAVAALAGPLVVTPAREAVWAGRVSRAIVFDTSASMTRQGVMEEAGRLADAEADSAFRAARFETPDLRAGLRQALAWLRDQPPSVREVVCISDFQPGALSQADLQVLPEPVGVRLVSAGAPAGPATAAGSRVTADAGTGVHTFVPVVTMTADRTAVRFDPASGIEDVPGVMVIAPEGARRVADAAIAAAIAAGAPDSAPGKRLALVFPGAERGVRVRALEPWMAEAIARIAGSQTLLDAIAFAPEASGVVSTADLGSANWQPMLRGRDGRALAAAAAIEQDGIVRLALMVLREPAAVLAPAMVHAALVATAADDWSELEPNAIDLTELRRWGRPPGDAQVPERPEEHDGRWFWLSALVLIAAETWVRRGRAVRSEPMEAERVA
jgi:hypothetical protein